MRAMLIPCLQVHTKYEGQKGRSSYRNAERVREKVCHRAAEHLYGIDCFQKTSHFNIFRDINSNSASETEELIEKQEKVIDQLDKKRKVGNVRYINR